MSVAKAAFAVIFGFSVGITLLIAGFPPAQIMRLYLRIPEMTSSILEIPLTNILDGITNGFFWVFVGEIIYGLARYGKKIPPLLPMPAPPRLATPPLDNPIVDWRTSSAPPAFTFSIPTSFGTGQRSAYAVRQRPAQSREKVRWARDVVTVRGRARHCFRDSETGRFVKKPI